MKGKEALFYVFLIFAAPVVALFVGELISTAPNRLINIDKRLEIIEKKLELYEVMEGLGE